MIGTIVNQVRQARALERANWTLMPEPRRDSSPTPSNQSRENAGYFSGPHRHRVHTNAGL
jgi:hypothetical protein